MSSKDTPHSTDSPEQSDSLGLHLKAGHPQKGTIELRLSQQVAYIFVPGLLILLGLGGWLWLSYSPHSSQTEPTTTEARSRK